MSDHDPLCPGDVAEYPEDCWACDLIARVRTDEQGKIAQPLVARAVVARHQAAARSGSLAAKYLEVAEAYCAAARIAREGGRGE